MSRTAASWVLIIALAACSRTAPAPGPPSGIDPGSVAPAGPAAGLPTEPLIDALEAEVLASIDPAACDRHIKFLSNRLRTPGDPDSARSADYVAAQLRSMGLDVRFERHAVLVPVARVLSIEMRTPFAFSAPLREAAIENDPDTRTRRAPLPFVPYSPDAADLRATMVYAHRGAPDDFAALASLGVPMKGAVALVRSTDVRIGVVAQAAHAAGMAGVILYTDPADHGFGRGDVYPGGPNLPASGIRRRSALMTGRRPGDPGTPGKPSVEGATHLGWDEIETLPAIAVLTMSHEDAEPFLREMTGPAVPAGWQGGMPFTYHVGGDRTVTVGVELLVERELRTITNVIATIPGAVHPGRFVLMGAPRDDWMRGARTAGATAALLEAARGLAQAVKAGRPPARTVQIASWDGACLGHLGSTEWLEAHAEEVKNGCVAYLHTNGVRGQRLVLSGSPSVLPVAREIERRHRHRPPVSAVAPDDGVWRSASETGPFASRFGVPTLGVETEGPRGVDGSLYDTYAFVRRHRDPKMERHGAIAGVLAATAARLAWSADLPLTPGQWGAEAAREAAALQSTRAGVDLGEIRALGVEVVQAGRALDAARGRMTRGPRTLTWMNAVESGLLASDRVLLGPGLSGRPYHRHDLVGPDVTREISVTLPGLREALDSGETARIRAAVVAVATRLRSLRDALVSLTAVAEPVRDGDG